MKQEVANPVIDTEVFIYPFKMGVGVQCGDLCGLGSPSQKLPDKNAFSRSRL